MTSTVVTVRELRTQWKPHKQKLAEINGQHPTNIRFHRACSWLAPLEELKPEEHADVMLIQQWIALNALYGQWDSTNREPRGMPWLKWSGRIESLNADYGKEIRCPRSANTIQRNRS